MLFADHGQRIESPRISGNPEKTGRTRSGFYAVHFTLDGIVIAYHFLPAHHAVDNMHRRRLKLALLHELNDPFDLLAADLPKKRHRQVFTHWRDAMAKSYGLLCFSRTWHNPLLWSHYGDRHRGICLGFQVLAPRTAMAVSYTGRRLPGIVERLIDTNKFDEAAMRRVLKTKFEDWKYEREIRLFGRLEDREGDLYFSDFEPTLSLREVILGARFAGSIQELLEALRAYTPRVSVIQGRLAFRSFRVVKNKAIHIAV